MIRCLTTALACLAIPAIADPPEIERVALERGGSGWTVHVTLRHADTGWDDYADGWRVLDMEGGVLGMRVLHHPHVTEQPFTRSLAGVVIPEGARQILVEARESVGGWSGARAIVDVPE